MSPTKTDDKPTLNPGGLGPEDPGASYVSPDLSFHEGTGTIPDSEKKWHEERNKRRDEEVEAANESEEKVIKERREREAAEAERIRKWKEDHPNPFDPPPGPPPAEETKTTTSSTKTTSSS